MENWIISFIASTVETGKTLGLDESVPYNCYRRVNRETCSRFYNVCIYLTYDKVVFGRRGILVGEMTFWEVIKQNYENT